VKRLKATVELISLRCVCGKAVIRATTTKLSVGVLSATVPDEVLPCPHCGSKDLKTARELQDAPPPKK
jgi:DNA-directed RNA polymerase subunit RPC12/RpoP